MSKERIKPQQFQIFDSNVINCEEYSLLENKSEIDDLYKQKTSSYKVNGIVTGTIIEKTNDGIKLDINYKSNGHVPLYEFNPIELKELNVGSNIEVMIEELENPDGIITLSYEKAKSTRAWEKISLLYKENKPVEGIVTSKVQGGLYVDIGIIVFLPGSQIDTQRVVDFDQWIGRKIQAYIIKLMPKRGNIVISRRKYMHEQKSEVRKEIIDTLVEGQVISGIVKNITKYGAFIDIGGVDGLLHITDITWSRIEDPTEIIKIGETINVKILSFDRINEKISLGMKQLVENPWEVLDESIVAGSVVSGKVISIKDYGIFLEVMKGVEGLIHISEISWTDRITDLNKNFRIGQDISAAVVSLERKSRRMSLSIKQMEKNPWDSILEKHKIGEKISGKVTNIADFGFFVQIASGIDGLVHISDISWTQHVKHPADLYSKGNIIDAIIIDINQTKKKISLSIKELLENPWKNITEKLPLGSFVEGTVLKIVEFGAFVKLKESNIEAFIHASECSDIPNTLINDALKVGESYLFKVVRISAEEQKIGLSLRKEEKKSSENKSNNSNKEKTILRDRDNSGKKSFNNSDKGSDRGFEKNSNRKPSTRRSNSKNDFSSNNSSSSYSFSSSTSVSSTGGIERKKSALQMEVEKLMQQKNNKAKE